MKFNKKMLRGGVHILMMALSLAFVACSDSDTEEDDNLYVEFTVSGSESDSSRTVTMKAPSGYEDKNIQIVYTLDDSTPELTFDKTSYGTGKKIAEYVNYGTASLYEGPITIGETTTIKAIAFYVDATAEKCVKGSAWSSKIVTVTAQKANVAETKTTAGASSGNFTFTLASTGNSNTTHYFDTSSTNVFKLNDEHENVYYQTSFSWKGKGRGNWYLYMRDLNGGLVKKDGLTFLANGSYTGNCFDNSRGEVADGELTLTNSDNSTGEVTISDKSKFTMYVSNSGAVTSDGNNGSSGDTLGIFTVADAK